MREGTEGCTCKLCVATLPLILNVTFGEVFVSGSDAGLDGRFATIPRGSYLRSRTRRRLENRAQ